MPTNIYDFEEARLEQVEEYTAKREVLGLADVRFGVRVPVPTTIYNVKGDDVSGVAGLLFPSGEFLPAQPSKVGTLQPYWEFDETLSYNKIAEQDPTQPFKRCAEGDSWAEGEVVWDGSVANSINQATLSGEEGDEEERVVVKRRMWDADLTEKRDSTGLLWDAIQSGRSMADMNPRAGLIHGDGTVSEDYNNKRAA